MDIETRLKRLEVSNGRWRLLAIGLLCVVGCGMYVAAAAPAVFESIDTKILRIVDEDGNTRIAMSVVDTLAGIVLMDSGQTGRVSISVDDVEGVRDDIAEFVFFGGATTHLQLFHNYNTDKRSGLVISDAKGKAILSAP